MSVKEFQEAYPSDSSPIYDHIIISGFIRNIQSYDGGYVFNIDDGTGTTRFRYIGGLGDIKEGDKVFVEIKPPGLLFSWDDVLYDNEKLIKFIEEKYKIEWVKSAKIRKYMFSWDNVPGSDDEIFRVIIEPSIRYDIAIDTIEKIDNGRTIKFGNPTYYFYLTLNDEKTEVNTTSSITAPFAKAKMENGRLNIYKYDISHDNENKKWIISNTHYNTIIIYNINTRAGHSRILGGYLLLSLSGEKATLTEGSSYVDEFLVKTENGKLNIYASQYAHQASKVGKSLAKSYATTPTKPEEASAPKTPGFEMVIGVIAIFFVSRKIIKRR